jgi:hypothetical protein
VLPGQTLLFLDEIQACPRAIQSLRYFREQLPDLHVTAAGSLLEFSLGDASFPVGRVQFLEMFPMTFAEFLWAIDKKAAADLVVRLPTPASQPVHQALLADLKRYFSVGGMPEAVRVYATTGSLLESGEVHKEILESYRADFPKYAPLADKACLRTVMASTARNVGRQIKYSRLAEGYSSASVHRAFDLLCQARIARKVRSASPAGLPLEAHASEKVFKSLFLDVGLMQSLCGLSAALDASPCNLVDTFRGAVAEQFVGQELVAAHGGELYFWSRPQRSSTAEVDYLVVCGSSIVPVEVKSGSGGRLRSLQVLRSEYPNCVRSLVFSSRPMEFDAEGGIEYLPLYFAYGSTRD